MGRKSVSLTDFNNSSNAVLSPDGRRLLYGGEKDKKGKPAPVVLMDLQTGKKTIFFSSSGSSNENNYGFAYQGALAWIWTESGDIKLKSLPDGEEKWIHRDANYLTFTSEIQEEAGILWSLGIDKTDMESIGILKRELELSTGEEAEKLKKELLDKQKNVPFILQIVDMNTFSETKRALADPLKYCSRIDDSLNLLYIHEDGSLYKMDLKTESDPVRLFGPVEGLKFPDFMEEGNPILSQCAISSDGLYIIRKTARAGLSSPCGEGGKGISFAGQYF